MTAPALNSTRLELCKLDSSYCSQEYVNWMNDIDVYRYLESGGNYTMQMLSNYLKEVDQKQILFWAIKIKASGKHIGNIKIDPLNTRHRYGEYAIMMGDRTEWGKGYAKEASELVINYCFNDLNLRKVTLGVVEDNQAAVSLYEKLGFEVEGIYKYHGIYDGKFCHVLRMALFNKQFSYS